MSSILEQLLKAAVTKQSAKGTTNSARAVSNLIRNGKGIASLFGGDDASELQSMFGGASQLKSLLGGNTSLKSLLGDNDDFGSLFGDDATEIKSLLSGKKTLKSLLDGDDDDRSASASTETAASSANRSSSYGARPSFGPKASSSSAATGALVSGYCKGCGAPIAGYAGQTVCCEYCETRQTLQKS